MTGKPLTQKGTKQTRAADKVRSHPHCAVHNKPLIFDEEDFFWHCTEQDCNIVSWPRNVFDEVGRLHVINAQEGNISFFHVQLDHRGRVKKVYIRTGAVLLDVTEMLVSGMPTTPMDDYQVPLRGPVRVTNYDGVEVYVS